MPEFPGLVQFHSEHFTQVPEQWAVLLFEQGLSLQRAVALHYPVQQLVNSRDTWF
jgi:hypothetical protein